MYADFLANFERELEPIFQRDAAGQIQCIATSILVIARVTKSVLTRDDVSDLQREVLVELLVALADVGIEDLRGQFPEIH